MIATRNLIETLRVGDLLPNCFGKECEVVRIFARGTDVNGKRYVCFYQSFGNGSKMSNSLTECDPMDLVA
jgi:hypothetical protein